MLIKNAFLFVIVCTALCAIGSESSFAATTKVGQTSEHDEKSINSLLKYVDMLPVELQYRIERFLYNRYSLMRNLHTVISDYVDEEEGDYNGFLVGDESCTGISAPKGKRPKNSAFDGGCSISALANIIEQVITELYHEPLSYEVTSAQGSAQRFLLTARVDNGKTLAMIVSPLSAISASVEYAYGRTLAEADKTRYVSDGSMKGIWRLEPLEKTTAESSMLVAWRSSEETVAYTVGSAWDFFAIDDANEHCIALSRPSPEKLYSHIRVGTHCSAEQHFAWNLLKFSDENDGFRSPIVSMSHSGKFFAIAERSKALQEIVIHIGSYKDCTQKKEVGIKPYHFSGSGAIKQLAFARNDSYLGVTLELEDKQQKEVYYMVRLAHDSDGRGTVIHGYIPRPRVAEPYTFMTTMDPYGEYVGACYTKRLSPSSPDTERGHLVVPTHYHLVKNLIPAFKEREFADRYQSYVLHEVICRAPGHATLSLAGWEAMKKATGTKDHLLYRSRVRLDVGDKIVSGGEAVLHVSGLLKLLDAHK